MQVYRDLRVLTARPTVEEEEAAPHRLYGHVDGAVNYSVGHYLGDLGRALDEADRARQIPIIVGGTGLYFKAMLEGLSDIPEVPAEVRERIRRESEGLAAPELHAALASKDPETACTLHPSDRLRILRALEVHAATGRPILSFREERRPGLLTGVSVVRLFLSPDRDALRRRIDARFVAMIEQNALEEVAALRDRHLDPMLPVMRAHGVPGLVAYLNGEISLDEAIAKGQADTRRYAKRQFTWFRHQLPGWVWTSPEEGLDVALRSFSDL